MILKGLRRVKRLRGNLIEAMALEVRQKRFALLSSLLSKGSR
ncbi:hypothetical protein E2C01_014222 [Portunus trituberculatus]|uniref:Uncharacterized protein n=1 Tax=Portunus trituberculatus TaxID=210409 RepID=A0A5B7DJF0_PORTR|nr:hypothetical protein [Portunus trituberculatus]